MKFLLDEDVPPTVAVSVRAQGHDAVSVHELGRQGLPDEAQLAYATQEGRVLVTYDRDDFQELSTLYDARGEMHSGILWVVERTIRRRAIGALTRALVEVDAIYGDMIGLCLPLPAPADPSPPQQD